jgi:hypothetical protein
MMKKIGGWEVRFQVCYEIVGKLINEVMMGLYNLQVVGILF